jgi:hypothetical protein
MELIVEEPTWFQKWSWKTVGWAFACFLILSLINGLFAFLIDVLIFENTWGYVYIYFTMIFFSVFLYFCYSFFKTNGFGLFVFGLMGIIGIGIELWLEYFKYGTLKSPWGAVGWGFVYILYGLFADLSMLLVKVIKKDILAIAVSSLIFSVCFVIINIWPLKTFYYTFEIPGNRTYLSFWYVLMPYSIITSILGAIAGMTIANKLNMRGKNIH